MKPPDLDLRSLVGQWIHKADVDYFAAERLLERLHPFLHDLPSTS